MDWDAYVRLAFEEIRIVGAALRRSAAASAALEDLRGVAPPERRAVLDEQLSLLAASAHASIARPMDLALALDPDRLGPGSTPGSTATELPARRTSRAPTPIAALVLVGLGGFPATDVCDLARLRG